MMLLFFQKRSQKPAIIGVADPGLPHSPTVSCIYPAKGVNTGINPNLGEADPGGLGECPQNTSYTSDILIFAQKSFSTEDDLYLGMFVNHTVAKL
jgi:hypothetical protein